MDARLNSAHEYLLSIPKNNNFFLFYSDESSTGDESSDGQFTEILLNLIKWKNETANPNAKSFIFTTHWRWNLVEISKKRNLKIVFWMVLVLDKFYYSLNNNNFEKSIWICGWNVEDRGNYKPDGNG